MAERGKIVLRWQGDVFMVTTSTNFCFHSIESLSVQSNSMWVPPRFQRLRWTPPGSSFSHCESTGPIC